MALERFDQTKQLANVKQIFWGVTETPKIVEQPMQQAGMKRVYPIDKATIQERRREMTPAKTDDPVVSYLNNNAPEWFMVDLPKAEKVIRFTKEKHPELEWEDVIKKAVEYLPWIKQYEDEQRVASQPVQQPQTPMQWGLRRWTAWNSTLEGTALAPLEPVNKFLDNANLLWKFTEFVDNNVQKIPTISRESMANALKWTPFEWMEVLPTMVANTPWSLLKTASATARGITNPFDTIIGLSKLVMTPEGRQAVVDRYGSIEWLKKTMTEDPVGLASDALTLVQWWANIASRWAKISWMQWLANKQFSVRGNKLWTLSDISKTAWWAADLWLSTIIPQWLQKATQFWDQIGQRWLLWAVWNTVIKWLVEPTQPLQMAKDIYRKVQEIKPIETIARKILWATDEQSKLFKAQEARTGQLNKSIDWKNLRKQSDMANEEIVRYWYKPTDTATRAEAHANTMQKIWDNEIKARIGNEFDIDLNNVADKIDEFVAKQADAGLVKNKAQLAELQAQSKAFREMWTVDWAKWEFIKEMINAQINNWGDSSIWDVYKNGMKEATRQLWDNLDDAFSRIPWEFADAKKRFWALKATYADVVKADIKAQKAKWAWLTETFSRIEWFGDILAGVWSMFWWKNPLPQLASWLWKLAVWKVLQKIKDKDFLIQEWFEWLSKKAGKVAPVIKASTNRKAPPLIEWSMEFQTPTARIGNTQPRWVEIKETGMENVKQPTPLVKSIAGNTEKKLNTPLVQSTKETQKLPVAKKAPLVKARESVTNEWLLTEARKYKTSDEYLDSKKSKPLSEQEYINKMKEKWASNEAIEKRREFASDKSIWERFASEDTPYDIVAVSKLKDWELPMTKINNWWSVDDVYEVDSVLWVWKDWRKKVTLKQVQDEGQVKQIREQSQTWKTTPTRLPAIWTDTPKLSPKKKTPLIKATPVSKVDGMKRVVKIDQLKELAKSTDKKTFVREFVDWWKWDQFEPLYVNWVEVDKFMLVPKLDELYNGKFSTIDEAISKFYDDAISKVDDALPVWEKMWNTKKMELSGLWGVKTVKPNNQLKFNQWADYEAVRLVVNDKDAMVARYWALRNKDMQALTGKWNKLTEWEKLEMKRILKDLWVDDKTATARHQFLKDEAKRVRSSSDQVLHEIKDDFWETTTTTTPAKWLKPLVKANVSESADLTKGIEKAKAQAEKNRLLIKQWKLTTDDADYWTTKIEWQPKDPIPTVKDIDWKIVKEGDIIEFDWALWGKGKAVVERREPYIANASDDVIKWERVWNGSLDRPWQKFKIVSSQTTPTPTPALWKPLVKANVTDTSDLTTSIKKAKVDGQTFDVFLSSQEKEWKILYHWTDADIKEFSSDFIWKWWDALRVEWAWLWKGIYLTNKQQEAKYYADLVANQNRDRNFRDKHSDYTKKIEEMFDKWEITKEQATEMYTKWWPMRSEFERSKNIVKSVVNWKIATKKDIEGIFWSKLPKKYIDDWFGKRVQIIDQEKINNSLKDKWFVWREEMYTMAGQKLWWRDEAKNIVIFDPKQIKTEAQLRTERDKLDNAWLPALWKTTSKPLVKAKVDDWLIAEASKKYLINGTEHTLEKIKASWAYKGIVESLDNLWVKWWTDDDIIAMLKKTQKPNTTNADRNRAITEIQKKYPRNVKPWKDDLPF